MAEPLKITILSILLLFLALLLQSTLLEFIAIGGAKPDLSLIILVFISLRKGKMVGQFSGFFCGLIEDLMSLPYSIGFSTLNKTIIGFLSGQFKGRMFISPILIPILIVLVATIIKFILALIISFLFPTAVGGISLLSFKLLFEILYNCFFAPFIFALLNLLKPFKLTDKEKR